MPMPKSNRKCSIYGCGNKHLSRGYCIKHYKRWYRNGHPEAIKTAETGAALYFVENVALFYDGDDCLEWPFATKSQGYGAVRKNGRTMPATRLLCEMVYGPPPTPKHHAAHNCGNGNGGCCNPKHLRWASAKENAADKAIHGTLRRGFNHPCAKLTPQDCDAIRRLKGVKTQTEVAKMFGVRRELIGQVMRGQAYMEA